MNSVTVFYLGNGNKTRTLYVILPLNSTLEFGIDLEFWTFDFFGVELSQFHENTIIFITRVFKRNSIRQKYHAPSPSNSKLKTRKIITVFEKNIVSLQIKFVKKFIISSQLSLCNNF